MTAHLRHLAGRGPPPRPAARRRRARPQLHAARDPGRRRPRRRLARAVPHRRDDRRRTIVFCGVHFMAETAKILSPDKTVLVPTAEAGCSLADTIDADQLRAWKAEHPGAVVVAYVNTTAAVKAESDICCTSSNAVQVVARSPRRRRCCSCPTSSSARTCTGSHRPREPPRLAGGVPRARGHQPDDVRRQVAAHPDAELLVHPECGCATSALWLTGEGELPTGAPDHVHRRHGRRRPRA